MPRLRVLAKRPISEWALFAAIFFYIAVSILVYFWLVAPSINGKVDIKIGADSDLYWDFARSVSQQGAVGKLVGFGSNFLGPALLGIVLKNGFAVVCFNIFLFMASLKIAFSFPGINKSLFGFLMLLNLQLFPSLTTLNKEILTLFAAVLTARYIYSERRSKLLLLAVCATSLFTRWEQLAIFIMFLCLYRSKHRKLILVAIVAAITVAYPLVLSLLPTVLTGFTAQGENGNTITFLNNIQAHYGFPIVLIPKILMSSVGSLVTPWYFWSGEFLNDLGDLQWALFQPLGCAAFTIVLVLALIKGKMNLHRPIAFLIAIQMIGVAVTPFVQPRYLYAVYILLCLELSLTQKSETEDSISPRWHSSYTGG